MSVLPRIALFLQYVLPRNSRNTQKLLAEKSLPQISQMFRLRSIVPRNTQNAQKSLAVGGCSSSLVGAVLAWLVQWRPLHPLVGCVRVCQNYRIVMNG